jgi:hypothetical protein
MMRDIHHLIKLKQSIPLAPFLVVKEGGILTNEILRFAS